MFGDTLVTVTNSKRGNKYEEVFATDLEWMHKLPTKRKSESHEALSLMIQRDGVPPWMIADLSKYQ